MGKNITKPLSGNAMWMDYANSDPLYDIKQSCLNMGVTPYEVDYSMTPDVFDTLAAHPDYRASKKHNTMPLLIEKLEEAEIRDGIDEFKIETNDKVMTIRPGTQFRELKDEQK